MDKVLKNNFIYYRFEWPWARISGGLLWWSFVFRSQLGMFWQAERLSVSQERLSCAGFARLLSLCKPSDKAYRSPSSASVFVSDALSEIVSRRRRHLEEPRRLGSGGRILHSYHSLFFLNEIFRVFGVLCPLWRHICGLFWVIVRVICHCVINQLNCKLRVGLQSSILLWKLQLNTTFYLRGYISQGRSLPWCFYRPKFQVYSVVVLVQL